MTNYKKFPEKDREKKIFNCKIIFELFFPSSRQINLDEILLIVAAAAVMTLFFDLPFGNLKKLIFDTKRQQVAKKEMNVDINANEITEQKKVK